MVGPFHCKRESFEKCIFKINSVHVAHILSSVVQTVVNCRDKNKVVTYWRIKTMENAKIVIQKSGHSCSTEVFVYERFQL